MKKRTNKVGKLSFPKAPAAIGERALAKVTGGGIAPCASTLEPCVRPGSIVPCVRPGYIVPCIRPG